MAAAGAGARKRPAAKKAAPKLPTAPPPVEPVEFDLDAKRAARKEAAGDPFTFRFAGEVYQIPPAKQWPLQAVEAFSLGQMRTAMQALLGPDQWARFGEAQADLGDLTDLFQAMSAWQGLTAGE